MKAPGARRGGGGHLRVEAEDGTRDVRWRTALPHEFVIADSEEMVMKSRRCSDGNGGRADGMMLLLLLLLVVWVRLVGRVCKLAKGDVGLRALAWAGLALIDPLQTKVRDGAGREHVTADDSSVSQWRIC